MTAKQARFEKLRALRKLGEYLGMWGRTMHRPADYVAPPREVILAAVGLALDPSLSPVARYAFAMMAEYWQPDWRQIVGDQVLGPLVDRNATAVRRWRAAVLKRDGHRCTRCGSERQLHAHHCVPWADAPELRLVLENGETLCVGCHGQEHPDMSPAFFLGESAP